ncbi:MAG: sulfur oxidation c-type cytochrome SoxX [Thiothrix sp.]|nr:sulfur oxidation c-type cytochrome SoxX [Thiothrix sp.]HPE60085.1 sulfur oxidation c-type cytochrome SoxX [Thiolinea sp.]
MRKSRPLTASLAVLILAATTGLSGVSAAEGEVSEEALAKGREIAFDIMTGNCLACHMMAGGEMPGNIGPPLVAMRARFPDRAKLREQIADSRISNPKTIMPPFGAHGILSDEELDMVTDFVQSL